MIPVVKPYLPSREKLNKYIDGIYERQWLTNNGPLVHELTKRLEDYLGVENLLLVSNGTLALQIAYRALGVSDLNRDTQPEAITTPFTFIATASSLKWDGVQPVFVDIDPDTWCLNPDKIEAAINPRTRAIVPVHVFGNACNVDAIADIAKTNSLKVIYDACHAFGVKYKGESLLKYGDAATLSFHATKLFHTVEGGAIVFSKKKDFERAQKMINFGIDSTGCILDLGINAKMSEFQAATGLCVLDEIEENLLARAAIWHSYERGLSQYLKLQVKSEALEYNYAYFPVLFEDEQKLLMVDCALRENGVLARRYFHPSLDTVNFLCGRQEQPVSRDIASRILCLPIYAGLKTAEVEFIVSILTNALGREVP